jgi:CO/xanthine dehydrogenase Mo-binding subunit
MPIERVEKEQSKDGEESYQVVEQDELTPWPEDADLATVGKTHPRLEGADKVTGRARYSYDMRLPGQLYARVLRSPFPHARITRIDTSRAAALPGVHAIISSENAADVSWYEESRLFDRTLRFIGDEVAAVAAESEEIAEDALRLIEVDYERLPFVTNLEQALADGAPTLHGNSNIASEPQHYARGDIEAGFQTADIIVEHTYTTTTALHNSLEPHGCTAAWEGDQLTLWSSTQSIWSVREEVAQRLNLPEHHVRVVKHHMGGGFGAKQVAWKPDAIAALLSRAAGRPVQLMLDREAENLAAGNRPATRQHVRVGARRDGTLTAISARIEIETGAYLVGGEASNVSGMYQTLYQCPNVETHQTSVYTNAGPAVAFRAPGHVEAAFALEQAMDELARALQIDPIALRLRNYAAEDQKEGKPYTTPEALRLCYQRVQEHFDLTTNKAGLTSGTKRRGSGFAAHDWSAGGGNPPGYASLKLNADGSVDVLTGTQDIGTGTRTGLAQIAAEELGVPLDRVALHLGDTASGAYSPASAGSATQATIGPAIRAAAASARQQLLNAAAPMLEEPPERLAVRDGLVYVSADPSTGITVEEVCGRIAPHMIQAQGTRSANPDTKAIRTFGAQGADVEVDIETGEVTVLRIVASHDCGRIINPLLVESQVIGGVTQGIGFALTEGRVLDVERGVVLNPNLEEYKVPTVADIPPIEFYPIDLADPEANPTGAKGIGEPPIIPTAPAIANAIFDAVGIRLCHAPISRQQLVSALSEQAASQREQGEQA